MRVNFNYLGKKYQIDDESFEVFYGKNFSRKKTTYEGRFSPYNIIYCWYNNIPFIEEGFDIHHKNFNHSDNNPQNLIKLTRKEHALIHQRNRSEETKRKLSIAGKKRWKDGKSYVLTDDDRLKAREAIKNIDENTRLKWNENIKKSLENRDEESKQAWKSNVKEKTLEAMKRPGMSEKISSRTKEGMKFYLSLTKDEKDYYKTLSKKEKEIYKNNKLNG